jgi:hypothetical protein
MTGIVLRVTLWVGLLLTLVGVINRYVIGVRGGSALLPLFLGMFIALLGSMAMEPQYAKRAMQGVTVLALLGVLGTLSVLPTLTSLLAGQPQAETPVEIIARALMLLLCGVLLLVYLIDTLSAWIRRARR